MEATTTLANLLEHLHIAEDPMDDLQQIKTIVNSLHPSALRSTIVNMSFGVIFDRLNTTNQHLLELSCDILERLLSALAPSIVMQQLQGELRNGLDHPLAMIREFCLRQIYRCVASPGGNTLLAYEDMALKVIDLLSDQELSVAKHSQKILILTGQDASGLGRILSQPYLQRLQSVMENGDTIRFRVYEIIVDIIKVSPIALKQCVSAGLVQALLNELYSDDILLQLNCMELLSEIAFCNYGLAYLEEKGLLKRMEEVMSGAQDNPLAGFLMPGLVKFFGRVCYTQPKAITDQHVSFIPLVFDLLNSQDMTLNLVAMDTIGLIGHSVAGKVSLAKQGRRLHGALQDIMKSAKEAQNDLRVSALVAIERLLGIPTIEEQTSEMLQVIEAWYRALDVNSMKVFVSIRDQPFTDLRCAVHGIFKSMAGQAWGQKELNECPGFIEHLLDRSTEPDKAGKEAKYAIVETLVHSPTLQQNFDSPTILALRTYHREGAFFVRPQAQVAIEDA